MKWLNNSFLLMNPEAGYPCLYHSYPSPPLIGFFFYRNQSNLKECCLFVCSIHLSNFLNFIIITKITLFYYFLTFLLFFSFNVNPQPYFFIFTLLKAPSQDKLLRSLSKLLISVFYISHLRRMLQNPFQAKRIWTSVLAKPSKPFVILINLFYQNHSLSSLIKWSG